MTTRSKLLLTAALALLVLTSLAADASAASIGINPGGTISAASLGSLTLESGLFGTRVTCPLTLTGTLTQASTPKAEGTTLGRITSGTAGRCEGGTLRLLTETPWTLTYTRISGTLPEALTGLTAAVSNLAALVEISGTASCLYLGRVGISIALTHTRGAQYTAGLISFLEREQSWTRVTKLSGLICPTEARILGRLAFTTPQEIIRDPTEGTVADPDQNINIDINTLRVNDSYTWTNPNALPFIVTATILQIPIPPNGPPAGQLPREISCTSGYTIPGHGTCTMLIEPVARPTFGNRWSGTIRVQGHTGNGVVVTSQPLHISISNP